MILNKGVNKKISYEGHDYEAVGDAPQSKTL